MVRKILAEHKAKQESAVDISEEFVHSVKTTLRRFVPTAAGKMMKKRGILLALGSVLLCGCSAHTWSRPNTSAEETQRDIDQCERDRKAVDGESFFFERCMFSKGYSED